MNPLFRKKTIEMLQAEMAGEHQLKRVLGPVSLAALGVGAIIGTGIFVLTGLAARNYAGPGLIVSFVVAGLGCAFAALCYAEFAAMAPVAGSAYTYAYTTLGELAAWIIGWDLVLEYAMGSSTVAAGWSHYFLEFLSLFKHPTTRKALITIPAWLAIDPFSAAEQHTDYINAGRLVIERAVDDQQRVLPLAPDQGIHKVGDVRVTFSDDSLAAVGVSAAQLDDPSFSSSAKHSVQRIRHKLQEALQYDPTAVPDVKRERWQMSQAGGYAAYSQSPLVLGGLHITINALALLIVGAITVVLIIGIRESAGFNAAMVIVKLATVLLVIGAGIGYVDSANWHPFLPYGWTGVLSGAGVIFFAYIGFDSISTHAEEARNPQRDVPLGILTSLALCTVLYILVAAVVTGMVPFPEIPLDAPIAGVFEAKHLTTISALITVGALSGITSVLLVMLLSQARVLLAMARDGLLPASFFAAVHPRFRTPHKATMLTGALSGVTASLFPLEALGHMVSIGTLFAFVVVCLAVLIMRLTHPELPRPFRAPALFVVAPLGILICGTMMFHLGVANWIRLLVWLIVGLVIYFGYSRRHSRLALECETGLRDTNPKT